MPFLVRFLPRQIPSIYDLWFDEVTVRYTVSEPQATRMTYVSKRLIRGDHGLKRRGIVYIASAFLMLMPQYLIVQNWGVAAGPQAVLDDLPGRKLRTPVVCKYKNHGKLVKA